MKLATTIASAGVAAVIGLGGVSVAGAVTDGGAAPVTTTSTTAAGAPNRSAAPHRAGRAKHVRRLVRRRAAALAARTIGISPGQLAGEVKAGKTIGEVATAHGVDPQTVIDALEQAAHARIEKAKDAGRISADRAAKLEQRVDTVVPKLVEEWHPRNAGAPTS
jgi:hypothetical protein